MVLPGATGDARSNGGAVWPGVRAAHGSDGMGRDAAACPEQEERPQWPHFFLLMAQQKK